jgi:hypothetical protein
MGFVSFGNVLGLCFCLLGNGCYKGVSRATAATVFFVKGDIVVGNAKRNQFPSVRPKSKICGGDTMQTSDGASINLALLPGAFAESSRGPGKTAAYLGTICRHQT